MIEWTDLCAHLVENGVQLKQSGKTITAFRAGNTETIHLHMGKKTKITGTTVAKICANLGIANLD